MVKGAVDVPISTEGYQVRCRYWGIPDADHCTQAEIYDDDSGIWLKYVTGSSGGNVATQQEYTKLWCYLATRSYSYVAYVVGPYRAQVTASLRNNNRAYFGMNIYGSTDTRPVTTAPLLRADDQQRLPEYRQLW